MSKFKQKLNIKNLQKQVSPKKIFKDRKLEDLLRIFGARGCKSMIELHTSDNFKKVEDPREVYTWPISPAEAEEMKKVVTKFHAIDAYERWDNVYTDTLIKTKLNHKNI